MKKLVLVGFVISLLMMRYLPGSGQTSGRSVITPDNARYLRPIQTLGRGRAMDIAWVGDTFVVVSSTGLWLYPAGDFNAEPEFLSGKHGWIHSFAVSPDGHVATGNDDGTITLWNLADKSSKTFVAHAMPVLSLDFNSDGSQLVSGSGDILSNMAIGAVHENAVKVWDVKTGELIRDWRGTGYGSSETVEIYSTRFAKDDTWIAAIGDEGYGSDVAMLELKFFNVATGAVDIDTSYSELYDTLSKSTFIAFNPNGKTFITDGRSGITVWDSATHTRLQDIEQNGGFNDAVYNEDGTLLATVSSPNFYEEDPHTLFLWDTTTWQLITTFGEGEGATQVAFSPDSRQIAVIQLYGQVVIRDIASQRRVAVFDDYATYVRDLALSSDGQWAAIAVENQGVQLYDAATLARLETIEISHPAAVAFSPDSSLLAITGESIMYYSNSDGSIILWNLATKTPDRVFNDIQSKGSYYGNSNIMFMPDGKTVIASLYGYGLFLWDTRADDTPADLQAESRNKLNPPLVQGLTRETLIAFNYNDAELNMYDRSTYSEMMTLPYPERDFFNVLVYNPARTLLAASTSGYYGRGRLVVWDTSTWALITQTAVNYYGISDITFSPDGKLLVFDSNDGTLHFLDTTTWQEIAVLQGYQGRFISLGFSTDGTYLLASTGSGVVQVWGIEGDE